MRSFAVFSDIHGNIEALEAVLADMAEKGVSQRYCLGDLVGYGPDPGAVISLIRDRRVPTVRGNYDEGVGNDRGDCGCYHASPEARADGEASYVFTAAALDAEAKAWLAALPGEIRLETDGLRVLLAHGSPRKINEYLLPDRTDAQLLRLAEQAGADVVCVGHVHVPYHRSMEGERGSVHYVSSGSVGKPKDGDPRAAWVEVLIGAEDAVRSAGSDDPHAGPAGTGDLWVAVKVHRVDYDVEKVVAKTLAAGLPARLAEALRRG